MQNPKTTPIFLAFILSSFSLAAHAGGVFGCPSPGAPKAAARAPHGGVAWVHPRAAGAMTCVLRKLAEDGVRIVPAYLGGYGCRPNNPSWHPLGLAMDVNQRARDYTAPYISPRETIKVAEACGVTSGAIWRYPDNGHFQMRSASRAVQRQRGYGGYRHYRRRHHYRYRYYSYAAPVYYYPNAYYGGYYNGYGYGY